MNPDPLLQARQHFLDGVGHFQAGRLEDAARSFESAYMLAPDRPSVLTNLGAVRVRLRRFLDAAPLLERAVQLEPDNAEAWGYLGIALSELGHPADALDAFDRALALNDRSVEAWSRRGSLLRELGRLDEAASSFERAIALGADDPLHRYYLAAARGDSVPATAPRAYVEGLFDTYADEFANHLVETLRYQAHEVLVSGLSTLGPRRWKSVLDLGCGTGLAGRLLKPTSDRLVGLDLSARMLEQAREAAVYDELIHADAVQWLGADLRTFDLVLAADVLIYVGALEALFDGVSTGLLPGGAFACSVEALDDAAGDLQLRPSLRYAHSLAYLRRAGERCGLSLREVVRDSIREDQGRPIPGLYCYFTRD